MFAIWGGIAGIQHGLPLLLDYDETQLEQQISLNVANRFRLPNKGGITPGNDADFSLISRTPHTISANKLVTRHSISPYCGKQSNHKIESTFLRGQCVFGETVPGTVKIVPGTIARFLRPID